ncbi:hypothetical protein EDB83DRAFT_2314188 [Lactarius deliciosus]|nr:hypothetical protein EDB83DRAFT_2314188 [Lactarius deliciosus]
MDTCARAEKCRVASQAGHNKILDKLLSDNVRALDFVLGVGCRSCSPNQDAWVPSAQLVGVDNQAAVISDPQNHVFVLKNSGFIAYGVTGSYDVLAIIDQTHFRHAIKDRVTGAILGPSFEVRMTSAMSPCKFVNQGLCRCVISGNNLELLPAGQHYLPSEHHAAQGLYTMYPQPSSHELDVVPQAGARGTIQTCRARVRDALRCAPGQDLVHIDPDRHTFSMVKQHPIGGDSVENSESSSTRCEPTPRTNYTPPRSSMAPSSQGLSAIHSTMDKVTKCTLEAQVSAAVCPARARELDPIALQNVDHENSNKVKQEGVVSVARIKAQACTTQTHTRPSQSARDGVRSGGGGDSYQARADAEVADEFAQETSRRRQEIERIAAFGHKAVFVPTEVMDVVLAGMVAGVGVDLRT